MQMYGADAPRVQAFIAGQRGGEEPIHPRLPYLCGQVTWAARHEMARTVEDVLSRRTRSLLLDARASLEAAPRVAELLAAELGRDGAWVRAQIEAYRELVRSYLPPGR
jgi:glycerol-3-phosphate dehydrogenase